MLTIRRIVRLAGLLCAILCGLPSLLLAVDDGQTKPNVILILADDLGWKDLGCYGSDLHETPHLDQLARDGLRYTQHYSACTVCSPTRAALMTGKYPARLHITDWIPGAMPDNPKLLVPDWTKFLPLSEQTLAEHFRQAGYQTASIGKWHLGTEEYYPEKHGFDLNIAGTDKPQPTSYHAPWNIPTLSEGQPGDYLTERLGEEAVKYIQRVHQQPFFLYLPHFAVHTPIQARQRLTNKYRQKLREGMQHQNAAYAAMLESLDATVGLIRQKLRQLAIEDRTIIMFASDNGGRVPTTSNAPLRYGKASAYEGGVRVPLIVHWPGKTRAGSVCDQPTITMDLFHTLVTLNPAYWPSASREVRVQYSAVQESAVQESAGQASVVDGVSLLPTFEGLPLPRERNLYWHYPHHQHYQQGGAMPYGAIRSGDWKLIEFYNDMHVELYNLRADIAESLDLAVEQPEVVTKLRASLHKWREEVGAQMPTPNPQHDASRPEYNPKPKDR